MTESDGQESGMRRVWWILLLSVLTVAGSRATLRSAEASGGPQLGEGATLPERIRSKPSGADLRQERAAFRVLLDTAKHEITSAAEAMPADKYGFVPVAGEFRGVRSFGQQIKHLAATNHILAAAALGEAPPGSSGDEVGPESVRTKKEILEYLDDSFQRLGKAIEAIGDANTPVKSSPISPLQGNQVTRTALVAEALIHAFDHYGQMVEYLRMNGVVPPASRP
jgi:uncharacterized damage-inducible protein DinB